MKPDDLGDRIAKSAIWFGFGIIFAAFISTPVSAIVGFLGGWASYATTSTAEGAADLASQQSMARAAWAMFYSSIVQASVGAVGLFALIATLRHTGKANAISERTAQIQLTPYLRGAIRHEWQFDETGKLLGVTFTPNWQNVGQTIALEVAMFSEGKLVEPSVFGQELPFGVKTLAGAIRSNIGPGGIMDANATMVPIRDVERQMAGETHIVLYSSAWLTDAFQGRHFVSIAYAPQFFSLPKKPDDPVNGRVFFQTYPHGNWYEVTRAAIGGLPRRAG